MAQTLRQFVKSMIKEEAQGIRDYARALRAVKSARRRSSSSALLEVQYVLERIIKEETFHKHDLQQLMKLFPKPNPKRRRR